MFLNKEIHLNDKNSSPWLKISILIEAPESQILQNRTVLIKDLKRKFKKIPA